MLRFSRSAWHVCKTCGRHNTLLIRWSGDWASAWSCWRPRHVRRAWRWISAHDARTASIQARGRAEARTSEFSSLTDD